MRKPRTVDELITLLQENPMVMYVLDDEIAAFFDQSANMAFFVKGDFSGDEEACNQELQRIISEMD